MYSAPPLFQTTNENLVLDCELFIPAASVYFRCGPEGSHGRKKTMPKCAMNC